MKTDIQKFCSFCRGHKHWRVWLENIASMANNPDMPVKYYCANDVLGCFLIYFRKYNANMRNFDLSEKQRNQYAPKLKQVALDTLKK